MGYSETNSWHLNASDVPTPDKGQQHLYFGIQAFPVVGVGDDDIAKAQYLNTTPDIEGSEWSELIDVSIV